jgi:serine/threonine protein kinase
MEWCEFNLHEYIYGTQKTPESKNLSGLSLPEGYASLWDVMEQVTSGVAFLHQKALVHRDLKPRNGKRPLRNVY